MRLRELFAAAFLFTVVGSVLFGSAVAWRSSKQFKNNHVEIGTFAFLGAYVAQQGPTGDAAVMGPNGTTTLIGTLTLENVGDFRLGFQSGTFVAKHFRSNRSTRPASTICNTAHFTGQLQPSAVLDQGITEHDGEVRNAIYVFGSMGAAAPITCQDGVLTFNLVVTLKALHQ